METVDVEVVSARVTPAQSLAVLSQREVERLLDASRGGAYETFRRCSLAVLNSASMVDDARQVLEQYREFEIRVVQRDRGVKLEIRGAPASAFVDGQMIRGIKEHLFAVLRDIVYIAEEIRASGRFDLETSAGITDAVFHLLRNARAIAAHTEPNLAICWGGHSISREEYDYTKAVGYELGLRGLDIGTGCGPGAMKGPMKGAAIAHAKQRQRRGRYVGISEPGIIAAESPNAIVNELVILPDIEKRLETFVRLAHAVVVFPGGVGTAEEILYLLGILLHPANREVPFPLILTGPPQSRAYFEYIDRFVAATLGADARQRYNVILGDPVAVARAVRLGVEQVRSYRVATKDAFYFNWRLKIDDAFQRPFPPTHANVAGLELRADLPGHVLAANLRRVFSALVAGNVKDDGVRAVERHGPFELRGDAALMGHLDQLLAAFVVQQRMRLPGQVYTPCYRLVS
ncbi:MAG TPA: nucleotide 5'-monophosphate nucleosidase PpnN [Deferrisomatales bacterium]|nr:nucleotide 5'-monophosphate nucleosidase PpnN [Deferrisomatales bacterium]